jgi:CheY-like chemotaxis protein
MNHANPDRRNNLLPARPPHGHVDRRRTEGKRPRVLLVEDDELAAAGTLQILISAGLEVTLARDGLQCVRFFSCSTFDLVLMDGQMPFMDGFEASRRLRQAEATSSSKRAVPIVATTGETLPGIRDKCLSAGMNDVLIKPFSQSDLLATLVKWVPAARAPIEAHQQTRM